MFYANADVLFQLVLLFFRQLPPQAKSLTPEAQSPPEALQTPAAKASAGRLRYCNSHFFFF